ncbi:DUF418 domain-containing protein [Permianibacter sp. IMCC34836]|uniref:DUF418 domain-containing protein n=1 Tax=Permianibacter fluminis TaxID=2738515 RepID=UPI001556F0E5|nr:DUF418 domain-containing protein [Permianibacter fluminis]NQD37178.1 DUF418 domain-containing protein [Permianibacter fluminis]
MTATSSTDLGHAASTTLTPVPINQRIALLDILRGFALIGILLMNIEWFGRAMSSIGNVDRSLVGGDFAVGWLVKVLVEGKFYKLFSLLFGMGFAVMLLRAQEHGRPFVALFSRRMAALLAFGLLHATLLWGGDILRAYAVGGMLLLGWVMLVRKPRLQKLASPGAMLKLSLGMMALPFLAMLSFGSYYALSHDNVEMTRQWQERLQTEQVADELLAKAKADGIDLAASDSATEPSTDGADGTKTDSTAKADEPEIDLDSLSAEDRLQHLAKERAQTKAEREKEEQAEITAFTQPSYAVATTFRFDAVVEELPVFAFMALLDLFPLFLFGYWLVVSGKIRHADQHRTLFRTMACLGIGLGVAISAASVGIMAHPASRHVLIVGNAAGGLFQLGQVILAAGYLGLFVTAVQARFWQRALSWLAPMGRMALTNYLTHSLVLTTIFYGYGFAQYGKISRAPQLLIVVAIIAAQALFSRWWLSRYRYGPMEWLWRSITYWQWQPLRLSRVTVDGVQPA